MILGPWAPESIVFELNIGFLVKNGILSPQEMSRIPEFVSNTVIVCLNTKSGLRALKGLLNRLPIDVKQLVP